MLRGASNFRDLGGLPTSDGRHLRSGVIFRSNSLALLTDEDLDRIKQIGLRTIVDLRTRDEVARSPSRLIDAGVRVIRSSKADAASMLASMLDAAESDEAEGRRRFSDFIASIPDLYADEYAEMFRALAAGETPLLINCSAGKDRTGVAVMLVLAALGVEREAVLADYLLSGERLRGDPAFVAMLSGAVLHGFGRLPEHLRAVMLGVHPDHAEAVWVRLTEVYGSVEGYLSGRLGLSRADLDSMRERFVGP